MFQTITPRFFWIITSIVWLLWAVFAIAFADVRFQADGAHYLLHIVQSETFRIEHQRYILAISQLLPLLGIKLGLSMKTIVVLNSLNNVVYFFGLFVLCIVRFKDYIAAWSILLLTVLGILHIQFIPMYEIWYGAPLVVVVYSMLHKNVLHTPIHVVLFYAVLFTALFAHPLLFIAVLFVLVFHFLRTRKLAWRMWIGVALTFVVWYVIKKLALTEYEAGKISMLDTGWNKAYENLLKPSHYLRMLKFFFTYYSVTSTMFLVLVAMYIVRRSWWKLALVLSFCGGHILLINFTHQPDAELTPYFERMYLPLVTMILIAFLFDAWTLRLVHVRAGAVAIVLIVVYRMWLYFELSEMYVQRKMQTEALIRTCSMNGGSKFILAQRDYEMCFNYVDWSLPMETAIRSSLLQLPATINVVTEEDLNEGNNRSLLNTSNFLFRRWDVMRDKDLNTNYFKIEQGLYQPAPLQCKR
jgi:hypothetical protein